MSPSPRRRLNESKKKQTSLDSYVCPTVSASPPHCDTTNNGESLTESSPDTNPESKTEQMNGDGKFENISDNGSEISDEGYRSLGVIQANLNGNLKRSSLHSQTSEEPELNGMCVGEFSRSAARLLIEHFLFNRAPGANIE